MARQASIPLLAILMLMAGCVSPPAPPRPLTLEPAMEPSSGPEETLAPPPLPPSTVPEPLEAQVLIRGPNLTREGDHYAGSPGAYVFWGSANQPNTAFRWTINNATRAGAKVAETFKTVGPQSILLQVSGAQGAEARVAATLRIQVPTAPRTPPLTVTDASGDTNSPATDLQKAEMSDDGETLFVNITLAAAQPGLEQTKESLVLPAFSLGGSAYTPFLCGAGDTAVTAASGVFGVAEGRLIPGATASVQQARWTIQIPLEAIEERPPFQVLFTSFFGEGCGPPQRQEDAAPDHGTAPYGGSIRPMAQRLRVFDSLQEGPDPTTDIENFSVTDDGQHLILDIHMGATQPFYAQDTVQFPVLFLGSNQYVPYACAGQMGIFGSAEGTILGGSVLVNAAAGQWKLILPLESIRAKNPFEIYVASYVGEGCTTNVALVDRAPDAGVVHYRVAP